MSKKKTPAKIDDDREEWTPVDRDEWRRRLLKARELGLPEGDTSTLEE